MNTHETTFYDDHPFDWTDGYAHHELDATLAPLLASFIQDTPPDDLVLDVGCGPGRVMSCLAARNLRAVGLDLSLASIRLMMQRTTKPGVVGNGMQLPFGDASVDRVIADGVIHHTDNPFLAFAECCRVLKPGGTFYAAVYKPGGHYQMLYEFPGAAIRSLIKNPVGEALVHIVFLPLYYLVHVIKSRGRRSWSAATNLFYDYFVTPRVEFISHPKIQEWSDRCAVRIVKYHPNPTLNVHSFLISK
jgi:ubiquinone/menaquinone biosynthesis C-methylase UbiE